MLLEFKVKNYRCFRDEQVFSMVASDDKNLPENLIKSDLSAVPDTLKVAAIYGPNAGGKTNILKAFSLMASMVNNSAQIQKDGLPFSPFGLDTHSQQEPTAFECSFVQNRVSYQYGFSYNKSMIIDEYLYSYETARGKNLFRRLYDSSAGKHIFKYGSGLKGQKKLWEQATRSDALFLSIASQLNSEQLKEIANWFQQFSPRKLGEKFDAIIDNNRLKSKICSILASADISISDFRERKQKLELEQQLKLQQL